MRKPKYSFRTLLLLGMPTAIAVPLIAFTYTNVTRYFFRSETQLVFPDFKQWQRDFDAAKLDREERSSRLVSGVNTIDDAMSRFAKHDFLEPETIEAISGWRMRTDSGELFHRSTLQRQSRLFDAVGESAVPDLLKWLEHDQIEIRYIASAALERITGLNPDFPHFATRQQLADEGWLENTKMQYEKWLMIER